MHDHFHELVIQILKAAREQGLNQKQLAELSELDEVALSRLKKADDARYSTLETLGKSLGKKLVWVDENWTGNATQQSAETSVASLVAGGKLFELK